jgi:G3E family GTPase
LESRLRLDGVVTLVLDAHNVQRQLEDTEEAAQQIAYADRILSNKLDLIAKSCSGQHKRYSSDRTYSSHDLFSGTRLGLDLGCELL